MSRVAKTAVAAFFFVLLGWLYIHTGQAPGGARALQDRLAASAEAALQETGHDSWARVEMRGRVAHLDGVAPNEAARMEAIGALKSAVCCGGVARVSDKTYLRQVVEPYIFEARWDEAGLLLSGYAPDRDARAMIEVRAERLFDIEVNSSAIEIASGAPAGANWVLAVEFGLSQLKRLDHGVLRIEGEDMTLFGVAPSPQVREEVARQLLQAPAPFHGRAEIERTGAASTTPATEEGVAAPVPAPPEAPTPSVARDACQADFNALLEAETVEFAFSAAEISESSSALLDSVAEVARRCSGYRLKVEGHTDSSGDPWFNLDLSQRRAQAVVDYLAAHGVDPERLTAEGLGSSEPIATNNTFEGRRRNRRIEIEVIEETEDRR